MVEGDGKIIAKEREVQIGARQSGEVEILSGLESGETVMTHGMIKARDNMEVQIRASEENDETLQELLKEKEAITEDAE